MSLWHCPEHGLVGPSACCMKASFAVIKPMTRDERERMQRALDRSVTVIDAGSLVTPVDGGVE